MRHYSGSLYRLVRSPFEPNDLSHLSCFTLFLPSQRFITALTIYRLYWLTGRRSKLNIQNKITLYKAVIKPVWTYGIQLWGTASNSNIEILQRFQSKTLRSLLNAPCYVTNETIHRDLKIPTVKDEIRKSRSRYNTRVNNHHNPLVIQLLDTTDQIRRLKRKYPLD